MKYNKNARKKKKKKQKKNRYVVSFGMNPRQIINMKHKHSTNNTHVMVAGNQQQSGIIIIFGLAAGGGAAVGYTNIIFLTSRRNHWQFLIVCLGPIASQTVIACSKTFCARPRQEHQTNRLYHITFWYIPAAIPLHYFPWRVHVL